MSAKKLLFVINPNAGKAEMHGYMLEIADMLTKGGYEVTLHPTQAAGELLELIPQRAGAFDMLVACGGDGTLNETLNGLMYCTRPPMFGYIPTGTVNDFAASLGISRDPIQAVRTILSGEVFVCDVGRFNDRYFSYVAAFGAFTDVAYQTPQVTKNWLGRAAYVLEGVKRLNQLRPYTLSVTHDGGVIEGEFLFGMVTNSTSVGGFKLDNGEHVSMSDGLLELVLIRNPHNLLEAQQTINAVLMRQYDSEWIVAVRTARLHVAAQEELSWTLDGEFGGSPREAEIYNCPGALHIMKAR